MSRGARFVGVLVGALGVFTFVMYLIGLNVLQTWVMRDLTLRSQLAVGAAREGLVRHWGAGRTAEVATALNALALQERILGAAACDLQGRSLATSEVFPQEHALTCGGVWQLPLSSGADAVSSAVVDLPAGPVHVSVVDVSQGESLLGSVVILHDLSYVSGRRAQFRWLVLGAFAALALGGALLTLLAARISWRDWTRLLHESVRGESLHPEFAPLLQDVRQLVRIWPPKTRLSAAPAPGAPTASARRCRATCRGNASSSWPTESPTFTIGCRMAAFPCCIQRAGSSRRWSPSCARVRACGSPTAVGPPTATRQMRLDDCAFRRVTRPTPCDESG